MLFSDKMCGKAEQKLKAGNRAFQAENFEEAVRLYGEAIDLAADSARADYFSNRAIARSALATGEVPTLTPGRQCSVQVVA